jgi:hypothetical protein
MLLSENSLYAIKDYTNHLHAIENLSFPSLPLFEFLVALNLCHSLSLAVILTVRAAVGFIEWMRPKLFRAATIRR